MTEIQLTRAQVICRGLGIEFDAEKWRRVTPTSNTFSIRVGWRFIGLEADGKFVEPIEEQ